MNNGVRHFNKLLGMLAYSKCLLHKQNGEK